LNAFDLKSSGPGRGVSAIYASIVLYFVAITFNVDLVCPLLRWGISA